VAEAAKERLVNRPPAPRLLAISAGAGDRGAIERWAGDLAAAGVPAILFRERALDDRALFEIAARTRRRAPGALLLVHRRPDLAVAAGAGGVHLPADGLPARLVRDFYPALRVGRSTHTVAEVAAARDEASDYVVFGPVFETPSKPGRATGLESLRRAVAEAGDVPVLALGGVGPAQLAAVRSAGAWGVAGIRLFASAAAARKLVEELAA
jgi:thiamine-phosphate pyrophosphorylase